MAKGDFEMNIVLVGDFKEFIDRLEKLVERIERLESRPNFIPVYPWNPLTTWPPLTTGQEPPWTIQQAVTTDKIEVEG